eukprot:scaffold32862_cov90-Isochrysis_galbana.AAC.1
MCATAWRLDAAATSTLGVQLHRRPGFLRIREANPSEGLAQRHCHTCPRIFASRACSSRLEMDGACKKPPQPPSSSSARAPAQLDLTRNPNPDSQEEAMDLKKLIFPHAPPAFLDYPTCRALRDQYNFGSAPSASAPVALVTVGAPVR